MKKMTQSEWEESVQWIGLVAGCVIKKDGKYLMVQEKQQKVQGLWNVPAGHVDKGETVEQAAVREVKEETGYEVKIDGLIGLYHEETSRPLKYAYHAHVLGGQLKIQQDEILDVKWLSYDELTQMFNDKKLRADWVFDAISRVEIQRELLDGKV